MIENRNFSLNIKPFFRRQIQTDLFIHCSNGNTNNATCKRVKKHDALGFGFPLSLPKFCFIPTSPGRITAHDDKNATMHPSIKILVFIFYWFLDIELFFISNCDLTKREFWRRCFNIFKLRLYFSRKLIDFLIIHSQKVY